MPQKPQVERRRRGPDFFANFKRALEPAYAGQADLVIHGGDLFFRSKVAPAIIEQALRPLMELANKGIPVYVVPGNHERSRIPTYLWTAHPNLTIFREPQTFYQEVNGVRLNLSGFPFSRQIGKNFNQLLEQTEFLNEAADIRLLCLHQSVEGARVGPGDYTFRPGADVIEGRQIPPDFHAVISGHIHRSQVLTHDLKGNPMPAPVIYAGSIERTSFAERFEEKHYVKLIFKHDSEDQHLNNITFVPLPSRPMVVLNAQERFEESKAFETWLKKSLGELDPNSVVRIDLSEDQPKEALSGLTAAKIRHLAPPGMNVTFRHRFN